MSKKDCSTCEYKSARFDTEKNDLVDQCKMGHPCQGACQYYKKKPTAKCKKMGVPIKDAAEKIKLVATELYKHDMLINVDEGVILHPVPGKKIEDMEAGTAQITIAFFREIEEEA